MDTVTAMAQRWSMGGLFGRKKQPPPKPRPPETQFHAVSIIPGGNACAAAHRFTRQRFLSAYIPEACFAARARRVGAAANMGGGALPLPLQASQGSPRRAPASR